MKTLLVAANVVLFQLITLASSAYAQTTGQQVVLIQNANIFDGKNETLAEGMSVLVEGNTIAKIARSLPVPDGATVIDAGGRLMTPGFIDMHYHIAIASLAWPDVAGPYAPGLDYLGVSAALEAERTLMRGFTSVRQAMGPSWGVKTAIDRGQIPGPRIWPSLRALSQFGGHGDGNPRFLSPRRFGGPENYGEIFHASRIANGRAEILTAVREQLKGGASQIKMMLGGGAGTEFDPIDGRQYTADEIRAAVEAAENFGTYVMAHVYTADGIRVAVENGVKSIEHGNFLDNKTAKLMVENGVWLSAQALTYQALADNEGLGPVRQAKARYVAEGLDTMFAAAKKQGVKIVFGTDVVFDAKAAAAQNTEFTLRRKWFEPVEILRQATSLSGELLQLSGKRSPYQGKIGVIEEGAYADILLVDGDPLKDISILTKPDESLDLIMKDGKIYKNTLR